MARKSRRTPHNIPKKHKTQTAILKRSVSVSPETSSTVAPAHLAVAPVKLLPDSGEVIVSEKYSDLPFEIRRVGFVTGIVIIVLLVLWLILK